MLEPGLYKEVFSRLVMGIIITDKEGKILDVNTAIESMLGYKSDDLLMLTIDSITLPEDIECDEKLKLDLIAGYTLYYNVEKRYIREDGILIWTLITVFIVHNHSKESSLIYMIEDISTRKSAEIYLNHVSTHDSLTGLYNRAYFDTELSSVKSGINLPVSIVIVDVDGLKALNDSKGHEAGDYLIIGVAKILSEAFRKTDVVARIGGDEFAILALKTSEDELCIILEKLEHCKNKFNESGPKYKVEFSYGAATACMGNEVEKAYKEADARMYKCKSERKKQI